MAVELPIAGWQEQFPLPESLYNLLEQDFWEWAHVLDSDSKEQLAQELIQWGQPLGIGSEVLEQNRPLVRNLELLIGTLVENPPKTWPEKFRDSRVYRLLLPPERGRMLRDFATQPPELTLGA